MGLCSLKGICWKNLLLLSKAAVCFCRCLTNPFYSSDWLLNTPFPSPLFSLLSRPIGLDVPFEVSQKALIADVLCFDLTDGRKQKLSATMSFGSCHTPLRSYTSGVFPFVQVPSDTQVQSCVIIMADDFQDFILYNNLIAIWYSNSAHCLNLLRCFARLLWCFLYRCEYMFTPSSSWYRWSENLIPHHHLFWGWFAEKTYSCIAVTYFAVFFCVCALQVLDPGSRFPVLPSTLLR